MNTLEPLPEEKPQGERIGPYLVQGSIARGSTSDVLRAHDERENRIVAIKMLDARFVGDPEAEATFRREAEAMRRVNHPNVARIYDSGMASGGRPYLVMEHVYGPSLERLIRDRMPLSLAQRIDLALQIAEGLQAGLKAGVLHRDIKPGNLLIDSRSHLLKIVDFGLAWVIWESEAPVTYGKVEGTPRYMSPEHCMGHGLDHRSDIYSLGATLYHLLAGQPPFDADTDSAVIEMHLVGHPVPVSEINPDLPQDLCHIVMRMLERDPTDRYQDYHTLVADLDEAKMTELARTDDRFRQMHTEQGAFGPGATPPTGMRAVSAGDSGAWSRADSAANLPEVKIPPREEREGGHMGLVLTLIVLFIGALIGFSIYAKKTNLFSSKAEALPPEIAVLYENERIMREALDGILLYRSRNGEWPGSIPARDAWGNRLRIYDTRKVLVSAGADGDMGSSDDWTMDFTGTMVNAPRAYRRLSNPDYQYARDRRRP